MFNEITKKGVLAALEHPTEINKQMVDAQQARRVLDRLVGYKISPILWDKVRRGLSAGRVQSVALKLVCDREREIDAFVPEEYWNITARLAAAGSAGIRREAAQAGRRRTSRSPARRSPTPILADLQAGRLDRRVGHDQGAQEERGSAVHHQQAPAGGALPGQEDDDDRAAAVRGHRAAGRRGRRPHHLHANRLDARLGAGARRTSASYIGTKFGPDFVPEKPNVYKTKADAQDAHEAIRPTSMQYDPESIRAHAHARPVLSLQADLEPVRRVADAAGDVRRNDRGHHRRRLHVPRQGLRAEVRRLDGGLQPGDRSKRRPKRARAPMRCTADDEDGSGVLPPLREGDALQLRELKPEQKFTQPPPRYSEATLVKALEENGIGRPSTYASIISVIQARDYVNKIEGRFKPTMLGRMLVGPLLSPAFDDILDVEYTRESRGGSRQDRGRHVELREDAHELLQEVREGPEARVQGDDQPQGRGRAGSRRWRATSAASRW